jgi:hypothetical protein
MIKNKMLNTSAIVGMAAASCLFATPEIEESSPHSYMYSFFCSEEIKDSSTKLGGGIGIRKIAENHIALDFRLSASTPLALEPKLSASNSFGAETNVYYYFYEKNQMKLFGGVGGGVRLHHFVDKPYWENLTIDAETEDMDIDDMFPVCRRGVNTKLNGKVSIGCEFRNELGTQFIEISTDHKLSMPTLTVGWGF